MSYRNPQTLLFDAIFSGDTDKVVQLISSGMDKNTVLHSPARWDGATVLGTAACEGRLDIVQYLVEVGTPVNFTDPCLGRNALHWAIMGDQYQVAKFLLKNGADVDFADKDGVTPLLRAVIGRNYDLTRLLLDSGADVNSKDRLQCSALHYACVHGDSKLVHAVIRGGCVLNNRVIIGRGTPLASLVHQEDTESTELLLDAGYDVTDENWYKHHNKMAVQSNSLTAMLVQSHTSPPKLKTSCRNVIRKQMAGKNVQKKIKSLNMPTIITSYLLLKI